MIDLSSCFPTMVLTNRFKGSDSIFSTEKVPPARLFYHAVRNLSIDRGKYFNAYTFFRVKAEKISAERKRARHKYLLISPRVF